MSITNLALAAFGSSGLLALALTPLAARIARAIGLVSPPRVDRWGSRPTPLLGGLAMTVAILVPAAMLVPDRRQFAALAVAMLVAVALGLYDDMRGLRPTPRLVGQAIIGCGLAFAGVRVEAIPIAPLAFLATVVWVVVIMNAINLMDNMDGLAAGVVAIAAVV